MQSRSGRGRGRGRATPAEPPVGTVYEQIRRAPRTLTDSYAQTFGDNFEGIEVSRLSDGRRFALLPLELWRSFKKVLAQVQR